MSSENIIKKRLTDLVLQGRNLSTNNLFSAGQINYPLLYPCKGWIAAALNLIQLIIPDNADAYRKLAEEIARRPQSVKLNHDVGELTSILEQLIADVDNGLISSLADKVRAEVFDDFLDHAKSYLQEGGKNQAGVIAGVVFEDSIRRICRKQNPSITEKGVELDQLISALASRDILTKPKAQRARAAASVRTKATHAQWDEFDDTDVRSTIEFTEEFISNHMEGWKTKETA